MSTREPSEDSLASRVSNNLRGIYDTLSTTINNLENRVIGPHIQHHSSEDALNWLLRSIVLWVGLRNV